LLSSCSGVIHFKRGPIQTLLELLREFSQIMKKTGTVSIATCTKR
jgi:hypothetical protein